jgi:hypothetical protein
MGEWRLGSWALAFALLGWVLLGAAGFYAIGTPAPDGYALARAEQHRVTLYIVGLGCEATLAALILGTVALSTRSRAANIALWVAAGFVGFLVAAMSRA